MAASPIERIDKLLAYMDQYEAKTTEVEKPAGAYRIVTMENDKGDATKMKIEHFKLSELESSMSQDDIIIKVKASGINFIDTYHRSGLYPNPSNTLGKEGSGIVIKIGKNVTQFNVNDYVCWFGVQGSYATHIKINANFKNIIKIPAFLMAKYKS